MWAFSDGDRPGALQPSAGVYSEASLRAMDAAVASAGAAGLRLTLVLVNYWPDYGGAPQYVQWARDNGEAVGSSVDGAPTWTERG